MFTHFKSMARKAGLLTPLISLLAFTIALAASGDLDPTFDGDGQVISSVPGQDEGVMSIAIQADGKIVAAGYTFVPATSARDFAVNRYNPDGSLDTTFSTDGRLTTNFGGQDHAFDVALQPNGKIILAGKACNNSFTICDVALVRYNVNGTLDTTFSADGKQTTDYGIGNNGSDGGLAIQSNGKIVVAGYMWNGADYDFAVHRYNPNGSLDATFSGDGMAHGPIGTSRNEYAADLAIQNDGKIVIVGFSHNENPENHDFEVVRLNANGTADISFSGDGRQTTNFGGQDYAHALALQPNGKIVVAGEKVTSPLTSFALARYNTNGSLDITFNGTGRKVLNVIPGNSSWAQDMIVQSDGKIVVIGGASGDLAIIRLRPSGAFDTAFSGDGKVIVDFGGYDNGTSLALQPLDGKYVLGGSNEGIGLNDFALARVLP